MRLSKYFTLDEMTASETAARRGLDNTPGPEEMVNLRHLCEAVLDPLRELARAPIFVSSGYRSPIVNARIGGSKNSQHTKGEACDITCPSIGNAKLWKLLVESGIVWDQAIQEFWQSGSGSGWIHVSFTHRRPNRRQKLKASRVNGRVVYTAIV